MNAREKFLQLIVKVLEDNGISYMITGSLGAAYYGEPRATNDIDIVVSPNQRQLETFISDLGDELYVSPEAAMSALHNKGMFNIIDGMSGWKVDLIILKDREFSQVEFGRRRKVPFLSSEYLVVSPEDAILSKLEWSKIGSSERQFNDAAQVAALVGEANIDVTYLKKWAKELGVEQLLKKLLKGVFGN